MTEKLGLSLQWVITGDGTAKFEAYSSNNGATFLDINADIAAAQTKVTGVGGHNMAAITSVACQQIIIRATETGAANTVTITAWLIAY
jgi:hypothetical protein